MCKHGCVDEKMCRCADGAIIRTSAHPHIRTFILLCIIALSLFFFLLHDDDFTPRPRGFYRIAFPQKEYRTFDTPGCPFTFRYPTYAEVVPDTDRLSEPCWMNIEYPQFRGTLYLSYKAVHNDLDKFAQDFYILADKHIPKAIRYERYCDRCT